MNTIHWSSELKEVYNTEIETHRYYIRVCGVWRRVSWRDYASRELDSNRADSMTTRVKGHLVHHTKTVYGVHYSKATA